MALRELKEEACPEVVGTLGESDHAILGFTLMQVRVTEQSQTSALDFKN